MPADWIAWIRLCAAPLALLEVSVEHGNYPAGDETWAWTLAGGFAAGAVLLFLARRRSWAGALGLTFDLVVVSGFVVLYAFEPSSPVRQLFVLVAVEGALRFGVGGGLLAALASAPALALFEWRASDRLDVPYDPGHVLGPLGIQVLVALVVGHLAGRAGAR